jgi:hypothetical protein
MKTMSLLMLISILVFSWSSALGVMQVNDEGPFGQGRAVRTQTPQDAKPGEREAALLGSGRAQIKSRPLSRLPDIDGTISDGEWEDAKKVDMSIACRVVEAYFKNDESHLYVALDVAYNTAYDGSPSSWWDELRIVFDAGNDQKMVSDWAVKFGAPAGKGNAESLSLIGTCNGLSRSAGLGAVDDSDGHVQYEIMIPLNISEPAL